MKPIYVLSSVSHVPVRPLYWHFLLTVLCVHFVDWNWGAFGQGLIVGALRDKRVELNAQQYRNNLKQCIISHIH